MANIILRRLLCNRNLLRFNKVASGVSFYTIDPIVLIKRYPLLNHQNNFGANCLHNKQLQVKYFSTGAEKDDKDQKKNKLGLFQKFKKMYKEYWYVLVPVHLVTSAGWFAGFYYLAKSGVDIPSLLESMHVNENFINHLRDSSMGYIAVSYALYKIATPLRYTVTLGGTTISINYLKKWGYIKPIPSREKILEIYQEKKGNLMETMRETKEELKVQSEKFREKKDEVVGKIKTMKDIKKEELLKTSEKFKAKDKDNLKQDPSKKM